MKILNRYTNAVIFEDSATTIKETVQAAVAAKADLSYADLSYADLSKANLFGANLSKAIISIGNVERQVK